MTLIISINTNHYSILLADRRISSNEILVDDHYNKMCILCCNDARVSIAFTGIATFASFDTSAFILETLSQAGEDSDKLLDMLEELRSKIGLELKRLRLSHHPLSILVSGYRYDDSGVEPCVFRISNIGSNGKTEADFFIEITEKTSGENIVEFAGMIPAVPTGTREALAEIARNTIDPRHALRRAVMVLQKSALSKNSRQSIGQFCNSAIISKEVDTRIVSTFHAPKGSDMVSGPNYIVTKAFHGYGVTMSAPELLTGPEIRKREPCWCDSGKRFKDCHFKKFGSSYVTMPNFRRPLTWVASTEFKVGRPSGKLFQICGAFE